MLLTWHVLLQGYKGEDKSIAYLSPTVRYCNAVIISQQFFWAQYTDAIRGMEKKSASLAQQQPPSMLYRRGSHHLNF